MIFADYPKLEGNNHLIIGDRLLGWIEIFCNNGEDSTAGSKGLGKALRHMFATFGVPDDLSSDSGPEFTTEETEEIVCGKWTTVPHLATSLSRVGALRLPSELPRGSLRIILGPMGA